MTVTKTLKSSLMIKRSCQFSSPPILSRRGDLYNILIMRSWSTNMWLLNTQKFKKARKVWNIQDNLRNISIFWMCRPVQSFIGENDDKLSILILFRPSHVWYKLDDICTELLQLICSVCYVWTRRPSSQAPKLGQLSQAVAVGRKWRRL